MLHLKIQCVIVYVLNIKENFSGMLKNQHGNLFKCKLSLLLQKKLVLANKNDLFYSVALNIP
jgi:hypothetical protein